MDDIQASPRGIPIPEIGRMYCVQDAAGWIHAVSRTFYVPTTITIAEPGVYVPTQGRIYLTYLVGHDRRLMDCSVLRANMPKGEVVIVLGVECYAQEHDRRGDPGWEFQGIIFVPEWYLKHNPRVWDVTQQSDPITGIPLMTPKPRCGND